MTTFEDLGKSKEAQWFNEHERELLKKARERKQGELRKKQEAEETAEREKLKALHWLRCPKCGHEMEEKTLESIEVDECGFCGGVYFDAGELEQLFSRKIDESRGFFKRLLGT